MIKNLIYLVATVFLALMLVSGFARDFALKTILIRGSIFAGFMVFWGFIVMIIAAVIKSEAKEKIEAVNAETKEKYTTQLDQEEDNNSNNEENKS
jgi:hypothetical protein